MGNRLTRIYTRTGDDGSTGLGDGTRVAKDDPRIEAIGDVDELNCAIGLLLCEPLPEDIRSCLLDIQHRLFDLGGELSMPGTAMVSDARVDALEVILDRLNAELPPLKDFILPGGSLAAARCHVARAVCRRTERHVRTLSATAQLNPAGTRYLNRLSDLLFVMARFLNKQAGEPDVLWQHERE
ncbi:MAG TPA: cob(I)yrinic acid a,c-diamide adenosyltransferase [Gammaproteobacteria bacterium]|nr:cob(I)yrinic acid a,c-diamide adenosyltransferase [Gammaproteobacteria bacterium]